jgi:hypothetical protein
MIIVFNRPCRAEECCRARVQHYQQSWLAQKHCLTVPTGPASQTQASREGLRDFDRADQWGDGQYGAGSASYRDIHVRSFHSCVRFRTIRAS